MMLTRPGTHEYCCTVVYPQGFTDHLAFKRKGFIVTLCLFWDNVFKKISYFSEVFFIKMFTMFDINFKWVEKQYPNFFYLASCEIELFSKKIQWKTISKDNFPWTHFFFMQLNIGKHKKLSLYNVLHRNKQCQCALHLILFMSFAI